MDRRYLAITTVFMAMVSLIILVVFSPGFIEYQRIRWRTQLPPERIEAGMTGMLSTVKATEEILGHGKLTAEDFSHISAEMFRAMQEMAAHNDLASILRVGYLRQLHEDPSGKSLELKLFEEIADDILARIDTDGPTDSTPGNFSDSLRFRVFDLALRKPEFHGILIGKIGNLDRLGLPGEQVEALREDAEADGIALPPLVVPGASF